MTIKTAIIVAVADNGVIGRNNDMPWHIKSEYRYFRQTTQSHPVITGRKNFEAMGILKDRPMIVVTRDTSFKADGVTVTHNLEDAITLAKDIAQKSGKDRIFIIGGAEIYRQALPLTDEIYYTEVHLKPEGDILFPAFDRSQFVEIKREFHKAAEGEDGDYTITLLHRKKI